jgi:hypothetical protein
VLKRVIAGAVFCVLGVIATGGYYLWRSTPRAAASKLVNCIQNSETDCVADFLMKQETDALGLDKSKLSVLLRDYVISEVADAQQTGEDQIIALPETGQFRLTRSYVNTKGSAVHLTVRVVETDEGFKAEGLVWTLLQNVVANRYYVLDPSIGESKSIVRATYRCLSKDRLKLAAIGITSIYEPGTAQAIAISTMVEHYKFKMQKMGIPYV